MELPDIDEENAALARTASAQRQDDLPDIEEANAQVGQDELPDIEEANAQIGQDELPDIYEANAQLQEAELPDIDVENGILAQKSQATQTPVVQTAQPTATVEQQPAPAEQQPTGVGQEMDKRTRQFNLGDKIYAAGEHIVEGLKGARDVVGSVANPVLKLLGDAAQGLGNLSAHGVVMPNGIAIGERGELGGNKLTPDELAVKRRNNIGTAVGSAINEGVDTIFPNEPNDNPVTAKIQKVGNEIGGLLRFTIGNAAALGAAEYGPTWNADYDAYIQAGKTPAEAAAWADLGGVTNAIFAMALKGIPVGHYVKKMFGWELPENLLKEAIEKSGTLGMKEVKAAMTNILAGQLFKNAVTEAGVLGGVGAAQTAATGAIKQLGTTGEIDAKALGKAALESFEHGAVTGATMAALPIAVKIPEARKGAEEPIRTAQEMRAAANASRFTPEQRTTLNMRIPEFVGDDAEMTGRVMDRISEKMADEAVNGTPEGKTPLRERLDDPTEMEIEIQKATEELLFEDNAAEVAKSVNTQSLGTKAADRATDIATAMPRTADKTESRIAGEIGAADPDMDAERVWEVAEYLAAHGEAASPDGQPLTKERIAEVEKAMVDDKAGVVPVEQPDGTFKTVNEVEAEAAREERKNGLPETTDANPEATAPTSETPAPALQMKPVDHSGDWAPVNGKTGVFHTAEFPEVEIALQDAQPGEGTKADGTPKKIAFIENLPDPATLDEAGRLKLGKFLYEQIGKADKMGLEEVNVGRDEAEAAKYMELVDKYKNTVKAEKFQVRADSVVGLLKKSGLASDVIATEEEFNEALAASGENGQALVADGKTYGFTDGKNVYLNPAFFSTIRGLNTPIHEFGHLAIIATKNVNRAVYDRALTLIKDTGYWKEVSEHPDYAALPDWKKAEEALTRLIADRGERLEATTPKGVIAEIKQLLVDIWKSFGNSLGLRDLTPDKIEKMSVEDLADAIRAEMSSGREFGTRELSVQEGDLKAKILRFAKYSKPTSTGAKAALEAAKKAWKGLSEEQKVALGRYGDTSVLKTQDARTIANGVRMLREWDARRARISKAVKEQIKRSPNEGQKKIITGSPQYYVSEVTGDVTSPFAFAIDRGLPIPRKGDWGWDAWERLTDGMKHAERRRLEKIIGGEHPKHGGMDRVLSDYAQWLGISWGEGARDFEHGRGIEDFLDDILKERAKFEQWKAGDRKTRAEDEADAAAAQERRGGMTDEEFAEEDAWVRASEARRVEAERMGEQDDLSDMPDFSRAPREDAIESNIRQMLKHETVYDPTDSLHFAYSASQNEIAFFRDNGDLTFDIIARDKLTPNGIKRVTEVSKFYRTDENGENLDKSIQEFKSSVRSGNMGDGGKAKNGTSADANGNLALGQQNNGPKPDRQQGTGTGEAGSVNDGEMLFSRGGGARLVGGRTRVAADQDHGERTPGGLAAARELADVRRAPVSTLGARRFLSLDLSSLEELRKIVSENVRPAHVARTEAGVARTEGQVARGKVAIWSDTIGVVDHTDAAAEKANLKAHGFFRDEDPNWCMGQSDAAIKAEKNRSEQQLSRQLDALGERRMRGMEPGGQTAERGVFADEVAKVVLAQERRVGGRLGRLQTIGKSVQDAVARMPGMNQADAEWSARRFLDWAYGQPDYSRNMSGKQLTAEMFGKWLVMPRAVERTAPEWANAIEQTVAADPKLADAFRTLADRRLNGDEYLMRRIRRQMSRQTEEALAAIERERNLPIGAGSNWDTLKEIFVLGFHDKMGSVSLRINTSVREKIKAMKEALRAAPQNMRPQLQQQIDLYLGDIGEKLKKIKISRQAVERGNINEGSIYFRKFIALENEATQRWGLQLEDIKLYMDQLRVIETNGRSGSFGEDVVQARKVLDEMESRLGPEKWRRMQQFGNEFFAIHERELLEMEGAEQMLGRPYIDYLLTQVHYVATERVHSVEELDAIEVAKRNALAAGVAGGDNVVDMMFDYGERNGFGKDLGEGGWTAKMTGSMAAKADVFGATLAKTASLQRAIWRNRLVIDIRDALLAAEVKGVRDLPRKEGQKFPDGMRYGHLNYMENGQKRTLVVPMQISSAFKHINIPMLNQLARIPRFFHSLWRSCIIDWQPPYWPMNIRRNQDSIEHNMPGMKENAVKTTLRLAPGTGPIADLVSQAVVRNLPVSAKMLGKFENIMLPYIPQMERITKIIQDQNAWQREKWDAIDRNDLAKLQQLQDDWKMMEEMLRGNMFVSINGEYRGEPDMNAEADALAKKGLRTMIEEARLKSRPKSKKERLFDVVTLVFRFNQRQQQKEDILAKGVAYLADRKRFELVRKPKESALLVAERVSIAQGERKGYASDSMRVMVPFFNMIEKGVVRHVARYGIKGERKDVITQDAKFLFGSLTAGLLAKGLIQYWILDANDGDEEKALKSPYGPLYRYARFYHDAYRNCSEYVRKNYQFVPLWTKGYTSIIMGGALTDEERILFPMSDYTTDMLAAASGIAEKPSLGNAIMDASVRLVVPDLEITGPIVETLRIAHAAVTGANPEDSFRRAPMFDQRKIDMRYESWQDFAEFSSMIGAKLANYWGLRGIYKFDENGVDNGRGEVDEPVEWALRKIPIISPVLGRMVKVQVGSPKKDAAPITAERKRRDTVISVCAERLFEKRKGDTFFHDRDWKRYTEQLAKFKETYGLDDADVDLIRARYLNACNTYENRDALDKRALEKAMEEAERQGKSKAAIWVMLGDR